MGIHSDWIKTFKNEVPTAFTDTLQSRITAGFIDGQIQLMKSKAIVTWDQFVQYQFILPIRRIFQQGATTVVLAFDDYANVPEAKSMTQTRRSQKAAPVFFHERDQLPPTIPFLWDRFILNRKFKTRVIQMVISKIPLLLKMTERETLIIDYKGAPSLYGGPQKLHGASIEEYGAIGEADLKFFRYAERFGNLLVVSTDSDYIPISLIRLETNQRNDKPEPRIIIQRLRVGEANGDGKQSSKKRAFEYVDVNLLKVGLCKVVQTASHSFVQMHDTDSFCMAKICCLIALFGGTDFSRGMPQIGPKRVWDILQEITKTLAKCFDEELYQLDKQLTQEILISKIYATIFAAHTMGTRGLHNTLRALQYSKLSERTKQSLPTVDYIGTSIANANWIISYWAGDIRNELDYGYCRDGKRLVYADQVTMHPAQKKHKNKNIS